MAYIKFKELTKYFGFNVNVLYSELPDYATEYMLKDEKFVMAYRNNRDYAIFTNKRFILFDKGLISSKKIHIIPYSSISSSAIVYKPGRVQILISMNSGYQIRLDFINMHHEEKEVIKAVYIQMMK